MMYKCIAKNRIISTIVATILMAQLLGPIAAFAGNNKDNADNTPVESQKSLEDQKIESQKRQTKYKVGSYGALGAAALPVTVGIVKIGQKFVKVKILKKTFNPKIVKYPKLKFAGKAVWTLGFGALAGYLALEAWSEGAIADSIQVRQDKLEIAIKRMEQGVEYYESKGQLSEYEEKILEGYKVRIPKLEVQLGYCPKGINCDRYKSSTGNLK